MCSASGRHFTRVSRTLRENVAIEYRWAENQLDRWPMAESSQRLPFQSGRSATMARFTTSCCSTQSRTRRRCVAPSIRRQIICARFSRTDDHELVRATGRALSRSPAGASPVEPLPGFFSAAGLRVVPNIHRPAESTSSGLLQECNQGRSTEKGDLTCPLVATATYRDIIQ